MNYIFTILKKKAMNIFYGTIINSLAIIFAGMVGITINKKLNKATAISVLNVIALIAMIAGIGMALKSNNILISMASLVLGSTLGIYLKIENKLNDTIGVSDIFSFDPENKNVLTGLTISCMISLIGPLAILGSLQNGIDGDASLLLLKTGFDGITTLILSSSLGKGVILSVIPIAIFQIILSLIGYYAGNILSADLLTEISATGGFILIAMALSIVGIKKFNVISLLLGLIFVPIFYLLFTKLCLI